MKPYDQNEQDGFVLFKNESTAITISIGTNFRLGKGTMNALSNPQVINIFFDDAKKRMMIKSAKAGMENVFRITKTGLENQAAVKQKIQEVIGQDVPASNSFEFSGTKTSQPNTVIFDLSMWRIKKWDFYKKKGSPDGK